MQYYAPASATGGLVAGDARDQVFAFDAVRTNLCLQSQALSTTPWALGGGLTVPVTTSGDPRGTGAGCLLSDAAGTLGELTQAITVANNNTNYVASCYFTLGTSNQSKFGIRLSGGVAVDQFVEFNPASGVVISSAGTYTVTPLVIAGTTWYRIAILIANNTSGNVTATPYMQPASSNVGAVGTLMAFGCQFETVVTAGAATPSAYLSTGAAAFTTPAGAIPAFTQAPQIQCETFLASGSSVAPAWANRALLRGVGGGGNGGSSNLVGYTGGGGGEGSRTDGTIVTVTPGTTYTVTIGAAGAATSFGALLSLPGGSAGNRASAVNTGAGGAPGAGGGWGGNAGAANGGGRGGVAGSAAIGAPSGNTGGAAGANTGGGGGGANTDGVGSYGGGAGGTGRLDVIYFRV